MRVRGSGTACLAALLLVAGGVRAQEPEGAGAPTIAADTVVLSLEEAVRRALDESEEIRLARSQVDVVAAEAGSARSQRLPQVNANASYTRTFASPFDTGDGFQLPDSLRFEPDTTLSLEERVRYLERRVPTAALGGLGQLFGDLPFGREHTYVFGFSGSQLLYSGGRVSAAVGIAERSLDAIRMNLAEQTAEVEYQVRAAYVQALLARAVVGATEAALAQADAFLEQERLRHGSGQASELDVLRAQVDRDNLRPQLVQARNALEVALLNVKRLTNVPMSATLVLASELGAPAPGSVGAGPAEAVADRRAALRAAEEQVGIRQQQARIARGAFLPNVALQMNYGRQLYPAGMLEFQGDWRTDWTVTLGVQLPIFEGFRRTAELERARIEVRRARLQVEQLREALELEYRQAVGERERAAAAITGRQATVDMAERVYTLTELRYEQGLATQLEVNAARLSLLQARTNLAQAVAEFRIAEAGVERAMAGVGPDDR